MKKYFDFSRFGKYFIFDLVNARNRYGTTALITGMLPLIMFFFFEFFSLVFTRSFQPQPFAVKCAAMVCIIAIVFITAPSRLYGFITEKRAGSDWLMVPASTLEKFISMLLILCVALPCFLFLVSGIADILISWVFPTLYGESLTLNIKDFLSGFMAGASEDSLVSLTDDGSLVSFSNLGVLSLWLDLCASVLLFALGAVLFKSGKVAKTILFSFLIVSILSVVVLAFLSNTNMTAAVDWFSMNAEKAEHYANAIISIIYIIYFGVILWGIYHRIKTIKH